MKTTHIALRRAQYGRVRSRRRWPCPHSKEYRLRQVAKMIRAGAIRFPVPLFPGGTPTVTILEAPQHWFDRTLRPDQDGLDALAFLMLNLRRGGARLAQAEGRP